jgi:general secretion pathway protein H
MNASYKSDGFSLIEILVVVVILAIVSTIALMSLGVLGDDRELRTEAQRMQTLLEIAQDEAIMQGREFGMEIMLDSFRFVEFNPFTNQWSVIVGDDTLRLRQLPEDVEFELTLEDRDVELELDPAEISTIEDAADRSPGEDYSPHLLIFSSGDMSPFELRITRRYDRAVVVLRRDLTGEFEILTPDD